MNRDPDNTGGRSSTATLGILFAILAGGALLWQLCSAGCATDFESLRDHHDHFLSFVEDNWFTAVLLTLLVHTALAALALPGASLLMLAAGSGFGAFVGTLICLAGCTAGATISMLTARHWLHPALRRRYSAQLEEFDARMRRDGRAYLFSLRLLPVLPFAVVNVAVGLSTMKTWTFVWISLAGMAASTFVYVNAGTELAHVRELGDIYSPGVLASLAALALMPWLMRPVVRRVEAAARA